MQQGRTWFSCHAWLSWETESASIHLHRRVLPDLQNESYIAILLTCDFFCTDFGIPEDAIQTIFKELFLSMSFSSCARYFPLLFRGSLLSAWTLSADPLSSSIWLNSVNGKWLPKWDEWGMRWEWFISLASLWVDHVFYQKSQLLKWSSSYRSPL